MIRNTDEYMMADGSPRYGVRIGTGLADVKTTPEPAVPPTDTGDLAGRATTFTAHQLAVAGALRFTVRNNARAEKAVHDLRDAYPAEYDEAEAAVAARLGSPKAWRRRVTTAALRMVQASERDRGLASLTLNGLYLRIGLGFLPLLVLAGMIVANANFWITVAVYAVVSFGVDPVKANIQRRTLGADNARVSLAAAGVLWEDVVDATFADVLAAKGIAVDPFTSDAARNGWAHLTRTAAAVDVMIAGTE